MNAWFVCALALVCVLHTAQSCSCVQGSFFVSRRTNIRNDFCWSPMVYSARVLGASCNCVTNNTVSCIQYTHGSTVEAELTALGECDLDSSFFELDMCSNLNGVLSVNPSITPPDVSLTVQNLTAMAEFGSCPNVCPFFNRSDIYTTGPCQYTVEVLEVFKPLNYMGETTLMVWGPDVLTSCGNPLQRLSIGETYVVGIGGACSPISDWSMQSTYSGNEINYLRNLRTADQFVLCGALGTVPSLITLTLSVLLMLLVAV